MYKQQRTRKPWTEERERDSCQHCNTQTMTTVFLLCQMTGRFKDSRLLNPYSTHNSLLFVESHFIKLLCIATEYTSSAPASCIGECKTFLRPNNHNTMYEAVTDNTEPTNVRMSQDILHFPLQIPSKICCREGSNWKYGFGHASLTL